MNTRLDTQPKNRATDVPMLAVSYLRVSTREQAERGGTDEGFSIPAQREANQRKADELAALERQESDILDQISGLDEGLIHSDSSFLD